MKTRIRYKGLFALLLTTLTLLPALGDIASPIIGDRKTVDGVEWHYAWDSESRLHRFTIIAGCDNKGKEHVTIPTRIRGRLIKGVAAAAFGKCKGLKSITIPASIEHFGHAFCGSLISFKVEDGNPKYKSVNGLLLSKDGTELICGINGSVTIPNSVTSIGNEAFSGCSGLTSVTIPASVTNIGKDAFSGCSGLTNITIPASVTSIDSWAFQDCSGLTSVTIPASVTSIGDRVFCGCSGLTNITIPASVTSIGYEAFSGCSGLKSFVVDDGNPKYKSVNGLLLSKDGTELICGINGSVTIPNSVTSIDNLAFHCCSGLTNITIPASVTSIGARAFSGCSGLKSFVVDDGNPKYKSVNGLLLSKDGTELIRGVNGSVVIPASVMRIGNEAFSGYGGLKSFVVDDGNPKYKSVNGLLLSKDGTELIRGINGSVVIPASVTHIGKEAFSGCPGLANIITIPASVTSIDTWAFSGCSGLKVINFAGWPPKDMVVSAGRHIYGRLKLPRDAVLRYNATYVEAWTRVIEVYGFEKAKPYTPEAEIDLPEAEIEFKDSKLHTPANKDGKGGRDEIEIEVEID